MTEGSRGVGERWNVNTSFEVAFTADLPYGECDAWGLVSWNARPDARRQHFSLEKVEHAAHRGSTPNAVHSAFVRDQAQQVSHSRFIRRPLDCAALGCAAQNHS